MKASRLRLAASCFLLAFCSLCYEFLLAQTLSILAGHTVFYYCLTIGLYVCALGIGTLVVTDHLTSDRCLSRLFILEIFLAIVGGASPIWFSLIDSLIQSSHWQVMQSWTVGINCLLIFIIGLASGMELPYLMRVADSQGDRKFVTRLLALDYLASFIGALSFPLLMFPHFGLLQSALILGLLNLAAAMIMLPRHWQLQARALAVLLLVVYGLLLGHAGKVESWLSTQIIRQPGLALTDRSPSL